MKENGHFRSKGNRKDGTTAVYLQKSYIGEEKYVSILMQTIIKNDYRLEEGNAIGNIGHYHIFLRCHKVY